MQLDTDIDILQDKRVFQSSPDPKAGCNVDGHDQRGLIPRVSILTRPEGRVQLPLLLVKLKAFLFQSSPDPKAGCNLVAIQVNRTFRQFQSSPDPKAGCNEWVRRWW